MPAAALEGLIAAHVPKKHISEVAEVYRTRWWDYRRMAPGHSFMLFAHSYYSAFKRVGKKVLAHRARGAGPIGKGNGGLGIVGIGEIQFTAETLWERDRSHITSLWNAMLVADAVGIPYPDFCRLSCELAVDRAWNRLPKPNQLYGNDMVGRIIDAWLSYTKGKLIVAKHPIFKVEHYVGQPMQDEYRLWLVDQIHKRENMVPALAQYVFQSPQIPLDLAEANFPKRAIQRAKLLAA